MATGEQWLTSFMTQLTGSPVTFGRGDPNQPMSTLDDSEGPPDGFEPDPNNPGWYFNGGDPNDPNNWWEGPAQPAPVEPAPVQNPGLPIDPTTGVPYGFYGGSPQPAPYDPFATGSPYGPSPAPALPSQPVQPTGGSAPGQAGGHYGMMNGQYLWASEADWSAYEAAIRGGSGNTPTPSPGNGYGTTPPVQPPSYPGTSGGTGGSTPRAPAPPTGQPYQGYNPNQVGNGQAYNYYGNQGGASNAYSPEHLAYLYYVANQQNALGQQNAGINQEGNYLNYNLGMTQAGNNYQLGLGGLVNDQQRNAISLYLGELQNGTTQQQNVMQFALGQGQLNLQQQQILNDAQRYAVQAIQNSRAMDITEVRNAMDFALGQGQLGIQEMQNALTGRGQDLNFQLGLLNSQIAAEGNQIRREELMAQRDELAANIRMQELGLVASLRGPRDAYAQQAVRHGINAQGTSNALSAINGTSQGIPLYQAMQAAPEAANYQDFVQGVYGNQQPGAPAQPPAGGYPPAPPGWLPGMPTTQPPTWQPSAPPQAPGAPALPPAAGPSAPPAAPAAPGGPAPYQQPVSPPPNMPAIQQAAGMGLYNPEQYGGAFPSNWMGGQPQPPANPQPGHVYDLRGNDLGLQKDYQPMRNPAQPDGSGGGYSLHYFVEDDAGFFGGGGHGNSYTYNLPAINDAEFIQWQQTGGAGQGQVWQGWNYDGSGTPIGGGTAPVPPGQAGQPPTYQPSYPGAPGMTDQQQPATPPTYSFGTGSYGPAGDYTTPYTASNGTSGVTAFQGSPADFAAIQDELANRPVRLTPDEPNRLVGHIYDSAGNDLGMSPAWQMGNMTGNVWFEQHPTLGLLSHGEARQMSPSELAAAGIYGPAPQAPTGTGPAQPDVQPTGMAAPAPSTIGTPVAPTGIPGGTPDDQYDYNAVAKTKLPSYARGTAYVPEDQVAQLHEGEMVAPAPMAEELRNAGVTPSTFSPSLFQEPTPQPAQMNVGTPSPETTAPKPPQNSFTPMFSGEGTRTAEPTQVSAGMGMSPGGTFSPVGDTAGVTREAVAPRPAGLTLGAAFNNGAMSQSPGVFSPYTGMTNAQRNEEFLRRTAEGLPAPNQINARQWMRLSPTDRDFLLSAYESQGHDINDILWTIQHLLPQGQAAYRGGTFAPILR